MTGVATVMDAESVAAALQNIMADQRSMLPKWARDRAKDFFGYNVTFLPLAAGQTLTDTIAIQNDSDFFIMYANAFITTTAAPPVPVDPAVSVLLALIKDSGSGRDLMDEPSPVANYYGTAQRPGILPLFKIIRRASTLSTQVQNLDTVNPFNVRFSYLGFKVFDFPADAAPGSY